ncbi:transcriptional regulator [Sphingomonas hylomeconis]|uniref:Transcriptional regulator n=1 Tax=Sphingomonas hylomeconis TaxID=1395958 RepID=A0ABV7SSP6_9SPHN|nr:helix-turn-helix domain-containing protein [Sphingomonas hylomeconis]
MSRITPFESLKSAVDQVGSQSAFARLCGVSQTAVWKWLQSGKRLPAEHVLTVERESGVSRHLLRPDIYPADPSSVSLPADGTAGSVAACAPVGDFDRGTILKRAAQ